MVQRRQRERSLFEVLLPDRHKLWPDWLRKIDTLLEDDAVIEVVAQALEKRWPQSRRRGRLGTPAEVVIRLLILKHLFDWSYDDMEREVRANLVYRMFTRVDAGEVPDAKTILKIARALGPEVIEQLHRQVLEVAKRAGVTHGRRFRIDTTVVETNVHYPTDSTLLQDSVRVLTRTMQRASAALGDAKGRVRNRLRSVMRRVLIIFERHTETIRKGKIATPNEFGKLVTIQESEHQIITGYEVHAKRPADVTLWTPALDRHQEIFGRAPDLAAADRGFSSARNEQNALERGVRRVILPRRGPVSPDRRAYDRQRW